MKMKKKIPTEEDLNRLDVESWGTWSKEVSEFDWSYDDTETCYILDGEVEVIISNKPIQLKKGEIVIMPANEPHALKAGKRFKILLTMIRQ